ncbi:hypothetical protein K7432_010902 [Basidiobolus ranarum]|uniref:Ribosomal protein S4 n=1 Tax=Basidiobolus ranarum TaxID=34480 RepID=A0ABR2WN28_9FUNG
MNLQPQRILPFPSSVGKPLLSHTKQGEIILLKLSTTLLHFLWNFQVKEIWRFTSPIKSSYLIVNKGTTYGLISTLDDRLWRVFIQPRNTDIVETEAESVPYKRFKGESKVEVVVNVPYRTIRPEDCLLLTETPVSNILPLERGEGSEVLVVAPRGTCFTMNPTKLDFITEENQTHISVNALESGRVTCSRLYILFQENT